MIPLYLAEQHDLTVSTDSAAPILSTTWKNHKKAGALLLYGPVFTVSQ